MMQGVYSVATIRAAESAAIAVSGEDALMQRAAAALSSVCAREIRTRRGRLYAARVLLAVGSGNNGGDALFAGARLARRGVAVRAWRPGSGVHQAGWQAFLAAGGRELGAEAALEALAAADLVVDGVTGIGGQAGLRAPVAAFARACAEQGAPWWRWTCPPASPPTCRSSVSSQLVNRLTRFRCPNPPAAPSGTALRPTSPPR